MNEGKLTNKLDQQIILLAEDDEDDVFLFKEALGSKSEKVYIQVASNGLEAMSSLQRQPHTDIVFLDVNMPRMNGIECLKAIKNAYKNIPVILLTTSNNEDLIHQAKELGASGFITKPGNFKKFEKLMNEVLAIDWQEKKSIFYLSIK